VIAIENGDPAMAILRSGLPTRRNVSQCIELARKHEAETGESPILDSDFADEVAEIIRNRKP
jgi:hypothetical protein